MFTYYKYLKLSYTIGLTVAVNS